MTETGKTLLNLGLTALVSAGTNVVVNELSKNGADRSANVGGANIDAEALKAQLKEAIYNEWLNDPIIQNRLRGPKGETGTAGGNGANGEMTRTDNMTNGDGFNYNFGIDLSNGIVIGKKGTNNNVTSNCLVKFIRNADDSFSIQLFNAGSLGMLLKSDGTAQKIAGGSFSAISDERVKDNIEDFTSGLAKVLAIQTKTFKYKKVTGTQTEFYPDSICAKTQYGVIAQQLREVCPEMVTEGEDGFLSVDLSNLPLMLVNAVKELDKKDKAQQTLITQQKNRIDALEASLQAVLGRLDALEAPQA